MTFHEGDEPHVHELTVDQKGKLTEYIWKVENVELTTVGIDIGSSTSHLVFARVRLQRKTQSLSSQVVVVDRQTLWKSPIMMTPFRPGTGQDIDAGALGEFVAACHRDAGLAPAAIDTGAVVLTGEAIKRANARAIAELFATGSGDFVCASAGHHLESVLAAHGSGVVARSRDGRAILNVDIGGGTTKLALVKGGQVLSTCAFAVGGRALVLDAEGRVTRLDESARLAAAHAGVVLRLGERPAPGSVDRVVEALARAAVGFIAGVPPDAFARSLLLTEPLERETLPESIAFSGGVAEYVYGREERDFGDIARGLAERIEAACRAHEIGLALVEPAERIRATVIGASQFTVQVSGKTIHVTHDADLPLRNVPVVAPRLPLEESVSAKDVAESIVAAMARSPAEEAAPVALALRWRGDPDYPRNRALAEGIALALAPRDPPPGGCRLPPLVLLLDGDIGRTLGHILEHELRLGRDVVSIDGIQLREFDFVDIGAPLQPANVVPVVIKSLLFPGGPLR
jgi:ethanolamine utilization protein EutA